MSDDPAGPDRNRELAAIVAKPRAEAAIEALRAEGVYDPTRNASMAASVRGFATIAASSRSSSGPAVSSGIRLTPPGARAGRAGG